MVKAGDRGEMIAAQYLEKLGYDIIIYNYRSPYGEIDIVASDSRFLVFVEVKLRKNSDFGRGAEFVDFRKQKKLRITAGHYLQEFPTSLQPRFDVLEIYAPNGLNAGMSVNHIENAF